MCVFRLFVRRLYVYCWLDSFRTQVRINLIFFDDPSVQETNEKETG